METNLFGMLTVGIFCSDEEISITRTVISLSDILSMMGGFANIIIISSRFFMKSYSKISFQRDYLGNFKKINGYKLNVNDS